MIIRIKRFFRRTWGWIWLFSNFNSLELRKIVGDGFKVVEHKHKENCEYCK